MEQGKTEKVMLSFIKETRTLWEYLKSAGKPIVLYGTGDGADKVIACLEAEGLGVSGIYASDEFVRGQQFHGFTVGKYSELLNRKEPVIALICFASELPEQMDRFYKLARVHETYAPHVPVFPGDETVTAAWINKYEEELQLVYDRLADEDSRNVFASVLNYRISGKLSYLKECTSSRADDLQDIFSFDDEETYVDLGAYDGDTIQEFLNLTGHRYKKIYAVEPDPKNFKKLTAYVENKKIAGVCCVNAGVWSVPGTLELLGNGGRQSTFWHISEAKQFSWNNSGRRENGRDGKTEASETGGKSLYMGEVNVAGQHNSNANRAAGLDAAGHKSASIRRKKIKTHMTEVISIDHLLENDWASYMKFDVEGVEQEALEGAKEHLIPDAAGELPKLLVAAYHHDEDIFKLPLLLWKLQPGYKIYMRKHPYVPDWEINLFAR